MQLRLTILNNTQKAPTSFTLNIFTSLPHPFKFIPWYYELKEFHAYFWAMTYWITYAHYPNVLHSCLLTKTYQRQHKNFKQINFCKKLWTRYCYGSELQLLLPQMAKLPKPHNDLVNLLYSLDKLRLPFFIQFKFTRILSLMSYFESKYNFIKQIIVTHKLIVLQGCINVDKLTKLGNVGPDYSKEWFIK